MTKDDIAKVLADHALWLKGEGGSLANLSWADLSRADLSWANLSWADLYRANLSGADLSGANLSRAQYIFSYSHVGFAGHGECGRTLTAIQQTEESEPYFCCGCFSGSEPLPWKRQSSF